MVALQYIQQGNRLIVWNAANTTTLIDSVSGVTRGHVPGEIIGLSYDETHAIIRTENGTISVARLADGAILSSPDPEQFPPHERLIPVVEPKIGCVDAFDRERFFPPPPLELEADDTGHWMRQAYRLPGSPLVMFIASWDNPLIYGWDTYLHDMLNNRMILKEATKNYLPHAVYTPPLKLLALESAYDFKFYDLNSARSRGALSFSEIDTRGYLTPAEVKANPRRPSVLRYIRTVATNPVEPEITAGALDGLVRVVRFPIMPCELTTYGSIAREHTPLWETRFIASPRALAFSPDGTRLAALLTSSTVLIFNALDGELLHTIRLP